MAILKTTQVDKVRLQANVGEKDLGSIKVGSPVTVTTTDDQAPILARVTSVFPYVDPGARTAVVEAVVENSARRLIPGQYVQMQFTTGEHQDAVTVPAGAVTRLGGKATVWVLTGEDQAEPREVATGLEGPDRVEIVRGLTGEERVVAKGQEGLYAGARIIDTSNMVAAATEGGHVSMPGMGTTSTPQPSGASAQAGSATSPGKQLQITMLGNPVKLAGGNAKLRFEVKDANGTPVSDAKVEVGAGMPGMNVAKIQAKPAKDAGVYETTLKLGMGGSWTVQVTATPPQGTSTTAKFTVEAQ